MRPPGGRSPGADPRAAMNSRRATAAETCVRRPVGTAARSGHWSRAGRFRDVVIGPLPTVVGSWVDRQASQPQPDAVHSDQRGSPHRRRRRAARRERRTPAGQRGAENVAPSSVCERDRDQAARRRAAARRRRSSRRCRGTARRTSALSTRARPLLVRVDEVGVPAAVGVVDLDDDGRRRSGAVEAPEHADRVEASAEGPRRWRPSAPGRRRGRCRARPGRRRRWRGSWRRA